MRMAAPPFAAGSETDVRQIRGSEFGRPKVGPQGAGQGPAGTKTAAGRFSHSPGRAARRRSLSLEALDLQGPLHVVAFRLLDLHRDITTVRRTPETRDARRILFL